MNAAQIRLILTLLLCLPGVAFTPTAIPDTDDAPIWYMQTQHNGKQYHLAWCLPERHVSRRIVLLSTKMPVEKWLAATPSGHIRAAINGPLFNSDSGVPFYEVGLGKGNWTADPRWTPCPVQRYCFGMQPDVTKGSDIGITQMAIKPFRHSPKLHYYNVPTPFQQRYAYGFSSIGLLVDDTSRVCSAEGSDWARMFPESELARSALVWTREGDFVLVSSESATWDQTGGFISNKLPDMRPLGASCQIAGAVMLDGGSTAQFGWAWRSSRGVLAMHMPIQQANENEVVPLVVGVEARYR